MRRDRLYRIVLMVSLLWPGAALGNESATATDGQQVYEREGCAMCHAIQGKGNRRSPLDGVGTRLCRDDLRKWIVSPQEMKPKVRKRAYTLSEPDLEALVGYLESLKE